MKITIDGDLEEIAALVLEIQGLQEAVEDWNRNKILSDGKYHSIAVDTATGKLKVN